MLVLATASWFGHCWRKNSNTRVCIDKLSQLLTVVFLFGHFPPDLLYVEDAADTAATPAGDGAEASSKHQPIKISLRFKRYVYDAKKKMIQAWHRLQPGLDSKVHVAKHLTYSLNHWLLLPWGLQSTLVQNKILKNFAELYIQFNENATAAFLYLICWTSKNKVINFILLFGL